MNEPFNEIFQEGIMAYSEGKRLADNPYSNVYYRDYWEQGFRYEEDRTGG